MVAWAGAPSDEAAEPSGGPGQNGETSCVALLDVLVIDFFATDASLVFKE